MLQAAAPQPWAGPVGLRTYYQKLKKKKKRLEIGRKMWERGFSRRGD